MTTVQHTKTQWYANGRALAIMTKGPDGPEIVAMPAALNDPKRELAIRDSIILEHNSHDELVAACKAAVELAVGIDGDQKIWVKLTDALALAERSGT